MNGNEGSDNYIYDGFVVSDEDIDDEVDNDDNVNESSDGDMQYDEEDQGLI